MGCCYSCVSQSSVQFVTQFGKFSRIAYPGFNCIHCYLGEAVAGELSLRVQQLDVRCESKTKVRRGRSGGSRSFPDSWWLIEFLAISSLVFKVLMIEHFGLPGQCVRDDGGVGAVPGTTPGALHSKQLKGACSTLPVL